MKTWICEIYGGGTPLYLISAKDEMRAWEIMKKQLQEDGYYDVCFSLKENSTGLIPLKGWSSEKEQIVDIEFFLSVNKHLHSWAI